METKQFKAESQRLLEMMIHSIYTHKEIFLRELISNASDAIDKLYFRSLTDDSVAMNRDDFAIWIAADKDAGTLTISDNGIGMSEEELERNLGTIAHSGSEEFKQANASAQGSEMDIIGQFGVGFYSSFMVADDVTVITRAYGSDEAYKWHSKGADGYTVKACEKETPGTTIVLHLKPDADEENYSQYLDTYKLREIVSKYSDYSSDQTDDRKNQ